MKRTTRRLPLPLVLVLALGIPIAGAVWWFTRDTSDAASEFPLSEPLSRQTLEVTIVESGSLEALKSEKVVSQVEGNNTILYLVKEGTRIDQAAIDEGKVLVRLDTAGLEEKLEKQELDVTKAKEALDAAKRNRLIQVDQNKSDMRKAMLDVHFARVDLERYIGSKLFNRLNEFFPVTAAPEPVESGEAPSPAEGSDSESLPSGGEDREGAHDDNGPIVEPEKPTLQLADAETYRALLDDVDLDGEARQRLRELQSNIQLAEEEKKRAETKLAGSLELAKKGYVSTQDVEADRLALARRTVELEKAQTARNQFRVYDFPKEVQRLRSALVEALAAERRTESRNRNQLAKANTDVQGKLKAHKLQETRQKKLEGQLALCEIKAEHPGLIVYASSGGRHWRREQAIEEGASVRERQAIITIPDPDSIGARISVHESAVKLVRAGQRANVVVDALPDLVLEGVVAKVATLPDQADRWLNPDLKVYRTIIHLDGTHPELKPGMSCRVEVLVERLDDVLAIPVQAVGGTVGEPRVWRYVDGDLEPTRVTLGLSNDRFVEVKTGLSLGDRVLLDPPQSAFTKTDGKNDPADPSGALEAEADKEDRKPGAGAKRGGRKGARRGS